MFSNHIRKMASEKLVAMDLLLQGYIVSQPISDIIENYDLLVEQEGKILKVQVKSAKEINDRMVVDIRRSSQAGKRFYDDNAYDVIAIANLERRQVAYIKKSDMTAKNSINIWCCNKDKIPYDNGRQNRLIFNELLTFPLF